MGSLIEELRRRPLAGADRSLPDSGACGRAGQGGRAGLAAAIAREEVTRLLEGPAVADPPAGQQAGGFAGEPRQAWPAGAVTVPPWQEGADASVLPQSYQDLLEVVADAGAR